MSSSLYRKYRPRSLDELIGQDHVKITLKQELASGRLAHAYLFTGPRGIGKTTTARLIARAVNVPESATSKEDIARGDAILAGNSLDIMEIDAASNRGIDDIRQLREGVHIGPSSLQYKVYIIDEVHMLTTEAFNALLKTLEEPPAHAIFILATTEVHKLPQTIISRCERFDFHRVSVENLILRLADLSGREKVEVDEDVLRAVAVAADGSVRDAESTLGQILALGEKRITRDLAALVLPHSDTGRLIELFGNLVHNETASAVQLLRTIIDEGANVMHFTRSLVQFLRGALLRKIDSTIVHDALLGLNAEQEEQLQHLLDVVSAQYLVHTLDAFLAAAKEIDRAYVPELPLEMAIVELTTVSEGTQSMDLPKQPQAPTAPTTESAAPTPAQSIVLEKKPVKKTASKKKSGAPAEQDLGSINDAWRGIVQRVQKENAGLALILNVVHPLRRTEDTLILACRFQFHADRLQEPSIQTYLANIMEEVLDERLRITTDVLGDDIVAAAPAKPVPTSAPVSAKPAASGDLWSDVVSTFGDDVVQG